MKQTRVLITGCGGMLGSSVYPYFRERCGEVMATDKVVSEEWLSPLDVRDTDGLSRAFREFRPDVVLHLAAETDLEYCETNPDVARDTNALATREIAKLSEIHGAVLVCISTAGVFDGRKDGLYTEDDAPNPIMVYGRTKYLGESYAREFCRNTFVVRAGWMMGGGKKKEKKFIVKILQQLENGNKEIFAVNDRWGTPTYTMEFAKNLFSLLRTGRYGTYHMVCEGSGTRFDVASEILKICNRPDIRLSPVASDFFRKEFFAPRPRSEMMANRNLDALGINGMPPWRSALKSYLTAEFANVIRGNGDLAGLRGRARR